MKQYICLSHMPWQAIPTRTQQLMTRMKNAEVLFFEPPHEQDHKKPGRRVRPGLIIYTLPPILAVEEKRAFLFRRNLRKTAKFVEAKLEKHRFREPVLWCTSPEQVHLLDFLAYRGLVYDCSSDWSRLPIRWESDLALAADVIFAASPGLVDHLSPCNDNIALLPNGVNYPMFCREDLLPPPEFSGLNHKILGYAGTIWADLDLSPILQAAQEHPDWVFPILGEVQQNPFVPLLEALPNVAFLGYKPLVDLPDYLVHFDVCLNLLRHRDLGLDIIPGRIYEYLSTGKPIVSMLFEDQVEEFPDVIYSAHSPAEFSQLCAHALQESGDWARLRRRDYGLHSAWSARADEVCRILDTIGLY